MAWNVGRKREERGRRGRSRWGREVVARQERQERVEEEGRRRGSGMGGVGCVCVGKGVVVGVEWGEWDGGGGGRGGAMGAHPHIRVISESYPSRIRVISESYPRGGSGVQPWAVSGYRRASSPGEGGGHGRAATAGQSRSVGSGP